jgi:hypothetical protein
MNWIAFSERIPTIQSGKSHIKMLITDGNVIEARAFYGWMKRERTDFDILPGKKASHWIDVEDIPLPSTKESKNVLF